jgi:hypothetical protein
VCGVEAVIYKYIFFFNPVACFFLFLYKAKYLTAPPPHMFLRSEPCDMLGVCPACRKQVLINHNFEK